MLSAVLLVLALSAQPAPPVEREIIVIGADWCPSCSAMKPDIARLCSSGVAIYYLDADRHQQLIAKHRIGQVSSLPVVVIADTQTHWAVYKYSPGYKSLADLTKIILRWNVRFVSPRK